MPEGVNMPTDLQIIEQVEKAIGKKLRHVEQIDFRSPISGYTIDDNKNIIGLSLYGTQITDYIRTQGINEFNAVIFKL